MDHEFAHDGLLHSDECELSAKGWRLKSQYMSKEIRSVPSSQFGLVVLLVSHYRSAMVLYKVFLEHIRPFVLQIPNLAEWLWR